jgi:hypothetical protein
MTDALDVYLNAVERIFVESLQDFYFTYPDQPVVARIFWRNGTMTTSPVLTIDIGMFEHLNSFDVVADFMLMTTDDSLSGCTRWITSFTVTMLRGSYLFGISPSLKHGLCPSSVIESLSPDVLDSHVTPGIKSHINITTKSHVNMEAQIASVIDELKRGTYKMREFPQHSHNVGTPLQYKRAINALPPAVLPPYLSRTDLSLYRPIARLGITLLFFSGVHLFVVIVSFGRSFILHGQLKAGSAEYSELDAYEQFHSVIGFWTPLSLLSSVLCVVASALLLLDLGSMTQFPSQAAIRSFGIASLFAIITGIRWLGALPACYGVVLIIRQAFVGLMLILLGIAPVVFGMMFVGIFLFGFVSDISGSMVNLIQALISIIFGDNLSQFYEEFTDRSGIYNLLSVVFMSCAVALGMWLFMTLFTAEMVVIYQKNVAPLLY